MNLLWRYPSEPDEVDFSCITSGSLILNHQEHDLMQLIYLEEAGEGAEGGERNTNLQGWTEVLHL